MKYIFLIIPFFFLGCVNKTGISLKAYPECEENYDLYGIYYYKCKDNFYNFKVNPYTLKKQKQTCLDCN